MNANPYILPLDKVGIKDIDRVGGKNASLGEMLQNLTALGINIPNGFVITVAAYRRFLEYNNLEDTIKQMINAIDYSRIESLRRGGLQVRQLLNNSRFKRSEIMRDGAAVCKRRFSLTRRHGPRRLMNRKVRDGAAQ